MLDPTTQRRPRFGPERIGRIVPFRDEPQRLPDHSTKRLIKGEYQLGPSKMRPLTFVGSVPFMFRGEDGLETVMEGRLLPNWAGMPSAKITTPSGRASPSGGTGTLQSLCSWMRCINSAIAAPEPRSLLSIRGGFAHATARRVKRPQHIARRRSMSAAVAPRRSQISARAACPSAVACSVLACCEPLSIFLAIKRSNPFRAARTARWSTRSPRNITSGVLTKILMSNHSEACWTYQMSKAFLSSGEMSRAPKT